VTISLAMRSGSICDPIGAPGAAFLLSRVIDRGTATRSADSIAESLDSRGVSLTVGVTRHLFSLACSCLAEDFEPVLALLGDLVMAASFPEPEIATRKGEIVTAIRQDEDNPAVRATEGLMALLYPGHPYGRPVKGTVASVESLTREQLLRLHADHFVPARLSLVVVGDVPAGRALDVAARTFDEWRASGSAPVEVARVEPSRRRQKLVIPMMNKVQTDIAYGFTTITRGDPAYYAYLLMNNVLGQYSMGGRLGDSIRERQGMAYYVSTVFEANLVEGPLTVRAGVSPANVERAVSSIDEEIAKVIREGITVEELEESRRYLIGSMPRALETNGGIAGFLQNAEFFGLGLDYDRRLPDLLRRVTLEEACQAARRSLNPEWATVVVAGPYREG
jgi:zinc protease